MFEYLLWRHGSTVAYHRGRGSGCSRFGYGQPSPWVGPGKPNLPLGLRGKAGGGARVTAGPKRPHLSCLKGVQPPLPFGERTRDCSPGHAGKECPQLRGKACGLCPSSLSSLAPYLDASEVCGALLLLLSRFSCVPLCATPQTAAHQAPPSLGSSDRKSVV